jgi:hypothetical protein
MIHLWWVVSFKVSERCPRPEDAVDIFSSRFSKRKKEWLNKLEISLTQETIYIQSHGVSNNEDVSVFRLENLEAAGVLFQVKLNANWKFINDFIAKRRRCRWSSFDLYLISHIPFSIRYMQSGKTQDTSSGDQTPITPSIIILPFDLDITSTP